MLSDLKFFPICGYIYIKFVVVREISIICLRGVDIYVNILTQPAFCRPLSSPDAIILLGVQKKAITLLKNSKETNSLTSLIACEVS